MRHLFRSLLALSALALPVAAHADTFSGSAAFSDLNNPNTNDVVFTGSFTNPNFTFTAVTGSPAFTDFLTITATTTQNGNGQITGTDTLQVLLTFSLPDAQTGALNGSGTITGHVDNASGTVSWSDTTITFSDGSSLVAHIPDFTFSAANLQNNGTAVIGGNMTLTVATDGTPRTPSVPEPSSIALMGTGLLTAANVLRKRLKA